MKLSDTGWPTDLDVYNAVDKDLGPEYGWQLGPTIDVGGKLYFKSQSVALNRTVSTRNSVGSWK
jgi:hypothetical protein